MNGFLLAGYLIYGVIRIATYLKNKESEPGNDDKPRYIINEKKSKVHPLTRSYHILDLANDIPLSPKVIHKALYKQLEFATEDRLLGYKRKYSVKDYQAAKMYLLDYYDYVAYLN